MASSMEDDDLELAVSKLSSLLNGGTKAWLDEDEASVVLVDSSSPKQPSPDPKPESTKPACAGRPPVPPANPSSPPLVQEFFPEADPESSVPLDWNDVASDAARLPPAPQQHRTAARPRTLLCKTVKQEDIDQMIKRMSVQNQSRQDRIAVARRHKVTEQMKQVQDKPTINKVSKRLMGKNHVPIHHRYKQVLDQRDETRKKLEETLVLNDQKSITESAVPSSHHARNSELVPRSKQSLMQQQSKEFLDHKKAELNRKRELHEEAKRLKAVSYTHLTLPTKRIV
eukprot:TRINITY_DN6209_c0_g1_i20.p1 TRINITY_DN6209_c0_g1~~TRINITY_DN6209_c0_g1_i20.p1  ORF type:complete len:284 (+),score=65.37 TRINITY_DN6209_c0_g1_i20:216-1067(+)